MIAPRTPDVDVQVSKRIFLAWILSVLEGLSGLEVTGGRWGVRATLTRVNRERRREKGDAKMASDVASFSASWISH